MRKDERELMTIQARMIIWAVQHLMAHGKSEAEARALAEEAVNAPPVVPLPTIDELDE
jgi:hypothetical protein